MKMRTILTTILAIFTLAACNDTPMPTAAPAENPVVFSAENFDLTSMEVQQLNSRIVNITGTIVEGGTFEGTFEVQRFVARDGQLFAEGILRGVLRDALGNLIGEITRIILMPAQPTQASCEILRLELGPLELNVLGLVVELDRVELVITAQPGPGNLLGNLLCAVAGLLDRGGPLQQLVNLLNQIIRII